MSAHSEHEQDRLWKQLAQKYAEKDGENLLAELEKLEQVNAYKFTPRLDEKVAGMRKRVDRARRNRFGGIVGVAAACLVAAVLVPAVIKMQSNKGMETTAMDEVAVWEESAPQEATEAPAMEEGAAGGTEADAADGEMYPLIPLAAELPENFSVSAVEQDVAKTIYYLDNTQRDNVVLTMKYSEELPDDAEFEEMEINGQPVYYKYKPEYSVMTFNQDGILYELSCEHDLDTLIELGEAIIEV